MIYQSAYTISSGKSNFFKCEKFFFISVRFLFCSSAFYLNWILNS